MMSLQDIVIEAEYRTLSVDMANDFYIPLLREAILYKRAVGFFSSSALGSAGTSSTTFIFIIHQQFSER